MMAGSRTTDRYETTLPGMGGRREHERHAFSARVQALPLDGRASPAWGTTTDISHKGLFICSTRRPPVDTIVVLKVHVGDETVKLTARVVHDIAGVGYGCELIDLTSAQRADLSYLVALSAGAPRPVRTLH